MFISLVNYIKSINLVLILTITSISCAPIDSDLCSVDLVPNNVISRRFSQSIEKINCSAILNAKQTENNTQFFNPVFDLSFGGAPRTGLFIIRGNVTCDQKRTKCWSSFDLPTNSIGNLIQNSGNVVYSCQVADQLINGGLARCENKGYIGFTHVLNYGDSCSTKNSKQECDINMKCGVSESETESESEEQCICKNGFVSIPIPKANTICIEEVSMGLNCNFTKQCTATDSNSICKLNDLGVKVCECNNESELHTDYKTDYIKSCRIRTTTSSTTTTTTTITTTTTTTMPSTEAFIVSKNDKNEDIIESNSTKKSENLIEQNMISVNSTKSKSKNKSEKASNAGIILFFLAIFLAIVIVIIIIRVRNTSNKMIINSKRINSEQQTDDNDGELSEPILTNRRDGIDEPDSNDTQTRVNGGPTQQTDSLNDNERIQTKV